MKKKVAWLVITGWMVAVLLLASCAPAAVEEEAEKVAPVVKEKEVVVVPKEETNLVKWTGKKLDGTVVEKMLEKPKYGGVSIGAAPAEPTTFDDTTRTGNNNWATNLINESLLLNDWTRGPLGTEDWEGLGSIGPPQPNTYETGGLATKWSLPEPDTLVYHIRPGVRFALDPTSEASRLVGGRELTAADVVYMFRRMWTIGNFKNDYPYLSDMKNIPNSIYVSPTDKWAVVLKSQPGKVFGLYRHSNTARAKIIAPEVIEKYGQITTGKWNNVVGTGTYTLKDYVSASSLTYVRNPSYWDNDPFFPENRLPYLDGFKILIIPDTSTRIAALRIGKIDAIGTDGENVQALNRADFLSLTKTNPELKWVKTLQGQGGLITMRTDTKPFDDIRVRRALMMAINKQEILDYYWEGDAEMFTYPVAPIPENINIGVYIPLEKTSKSLQELFGYYPDKARQLLTEAGYPQGFKTEIVATQRHVDILSIVKEDWAKIGVDLKIDVRDATVWQSIQARKTHTQMLMDDGGVYYQDIWTFRVLAGGTRNYSIVNDPYHQRLFDMLYENYFDPAMIVTIQTKPISELIPGAPKDLPSYIEYRAGQVWDINLPQPYGYILWQPWLKGFTAAPYLAAWNATTSWPKYAWIDQELKKALGR